MNYPANVTEHPVTTGEAGVISSPRLAAFPIRQTRPRKAVIPVNAALVRISVMTFDVFLIKRRTNSVKIYNIVAVKQDVISYIPITARVAVGRRAPPFNIRLEPVNPKNGVLLKLLGSYWQECVVYATVASLFLIYPCLVAPQLGQNQPHAGFELYTPIGRRVFRTAFSGIFIPILCVNYPATLTEQRQQNTNLNAPQQPHRNG